MPKFLILLILIFCVTALESKKVSKYDDFFQKTRFIMSKEEIEIYKHLPDDQAREEFIQEFWQKRDPTPDTPENEAFEEYQQRIDFANRYFRENRPSGFGWNTDRGRIVLQLGIPEKRYFQGFNRSGQIEVFYYESYQLVIEFIDRFGNGEYTLHNPPAQLLSVLDREIKNLNSFSSDKKRNYITFEAEIKNDLLTITVPVKRITFQENDDLLSARLDLSIFIYQNYSKIGQLDFPIEINEKSSIILEQKKLTFTFPLKLEGKGKFLLDIILRETISNSRFRQLVDLKK